MKVAVVGNGATERAIRTNAWRRSALLPAVLLALATIPSGVGAQAGGHIDHAVRVTLEEMGGHGAVWVFFTDKGERSGEMEHAKVTGRAETRRRRAGYVSGDGDLPLDAAYIRAVERIAGPVRARTKWLNGVSVEVDENDIDRLAALPFVREIRAVARRATRVEPPTGEPVPRNEAAEKPATDSLSYGLAYDQLHQINVPPLHNAGLSGKGVHILMLDSGFYTAAAAYDSMDIRNRWDFVHDDSTVSDEVGEEGAGDHGSGTLSTIGAFDPGMLIGPAFGATYELAKTEDSAGEYEQEEDFWVEGLEWGESLGVDLVSSSLGYIDWYTYEDMDGETAVTTLGAREAIRRGVIIVNSQGNEADKAWRHLIAPADGDSVLSVGAVTINGNRASFSSFGPTFDGRIKPDVSALGTSVNAVRTPKDTTGNVYGTWSGTSFSAPLTAGVCALLLEAHPWMTVHDLFPAIKAGASRADDPDTLIGWGVIDAFDAVTRPIVLHEPPRADSWAEGGYTGEVRLRLPVGFDPPVVVWNDGTSIPDTAFLVVASPAAHHDPPTRQGDLYRFTLAAPEGKSVRYYFAGEAGGAAWTSPPGAPEEQFAIGDFAEESEGYALHYSLDGEGPTNPFDRKEGASYPIFFDLPTETNVTARIYTAAGRLVRELLHETRGAGKGQSIVWDLKNDRGEDVSAGVYLLLFEAGPFEGRRTIVIL